MGLCLNIGSGLSGGKNWTNFDCSLTMILVRIPFIGTLLTRHAGFPAWPRGTRYGNILSQGLVPDNSCDLIFLSHVLEHLTRQCALQAVGNCYRFLKPGGIFRIIVPDLESITRNYLRGVDVEDVGASDKYMMDLGMAPPETATAWKSKIRCIFGHSQHQWMYDRYSILSLLRERGFSENRIAGFGDWNDERFSEVEDKGRHLNAICTESRKPGISGLRKESS